MVVNRAAAEEAERQARIAKRSQEFAKLAARKGLSSQATAIGFQLIKAGKTATAAMRAAKKADPSFSQRKQAKQQKKVLIKPKTLQKKQNLQSRRE